MSRLNKNREYFENINWTVEKVRQEIENGLSLLNKIDKPIATFFGSPRVLPTSKYYLHAKQVAYELGKSGYAILSGGGPGIMHAVNSGATEAKTDSLAMKAYLLTGERVTDKIFTEELQFHFLFARRFLMAIKSEALIFYPGGYGTLNELFEYAVLMQIGIVDTVPIICVKKDYWEGLFNWLRDNPLKEDFFVHDAKDINLLHFAENSKEISDLIVG